MGFHFDLPRLTGSPEQQLAQLKSYIYQLIPQLEWALNTLAKQQEENTGGKNNEQ